MTAVADAEQRVLGVGGLGSGSAPHAGHGIGASGPVTVGAERAQQATTRSATESISSSATSSGRAAAGPARRAGRSRSEPVATATRVLAAYDLLTAD